jgi:hypothetical protein
LGVFHHGLIILWAQTMVEPWYVSISVCLWAIIMFRLCT